MMIMTDTPLPGFSEEMIERYSRQIILNRVGGKGMQKLQGATIAVVGAGGLGCPAIQTLAAAGIGHLKIADGDRVDLSNLPRQYLHHTADVGKKKVDSALEKVQSMNPDVRVTIHDQYINAKSIGDFLAGSDFAIEASDNLATKFLVNDACVHFNIPFVIAGAVQYYGQVLQVRPGASACYRCVFEGPTVENPEMTCSGAGVLATAPVIAGTIQANEAIKHVLGIPSSMEGTMLIFDVLENNFDRIRVNQRQDCIACGGPRESMPLHARFNYADYDNRCKL